MIVTRQRKRRRGAARYVVPLLVLAALALALAWPPAHHVIADGPLAPVWNTGAQGVALPPSYTLFGQVTAGTDTTLKALDAAGTAAGTPKEAITITSVRITES